MEITWYGHSCFRLYTRGTSVITDPYSRELGYTLPRVKVDITTISHDHAGHNNAKGLKGDYFVIDEPGEYEIGGVFIIGIAAYHDRKKGKERGRNNIYLFEIEGISVCHLGDLGHIPTQTQVEALNDIDVLLTPVGGISALTAGMAAETASMLEPRIVIPMHYKTPFIKRKLSSVNGFLKEMGAEDLKPEESLKITKSKLPEETDVVLLECNQ